MAAFDFPRSDARTLPGSVLERAGVAIANSVRAWRNRREFYRLGEMNDFELKDIGLTRSDLHVAVAEPFGADPTARLRALVDGRN